MCCPFFFSLILSVCYSHKSDLWKDCKMSANYPKALQSWCSSKTVTQYWLWWTEVFFWVNFPDKEKCLLIPQTGVSQKRLQRVPHDDYTCAACSPKDKREQHCKMGTTARLTHTAVAMHLQNGFKVLLVSLIDVTWNISRSFCFWYIVEMCLMGPPWCPVSCWLMVFLGIKEYCVPEKSHFQSFIYWLSYKINL